MLGAVPSQFSTSSWGNPNSSKVSVSLPSPSPSHLAIWSDVVHFVLAQVTDDLNRVFMKDFELQDPLGLIQCHMPRVPDPGFDLALPVGTHLSPRIWLFQVSNRFRGEPTMATNSWAVCGLQCQRGGQFYKTDSLNLG